MSRVIHFPTPEEDERSLAEFLTSTNQLIKERRAACEQAIPALERLAIVMQGRSGQPYKVRTILFSLWNGKPAAVNEVLGLDWAIRKDLCAVLLAFGFEDMTVAFFYDALRKAIEDAGQWNWFIEESDNLELLEEYVKAGKERKEGL